MTILDKKKQQSEEMYFLASFLYNKKQYDKAQHIIHLLLMHHPYEKKHWFMLAASLQGQKQYKRAAKSWAMTALLDDTDPYPHFHAAECLYFSSDKQQTIKALKEVRKRCINNQYDNLKKMVKKLEKHCQIKHSAMKG